MKFYSLDMELRTKGALVELSDPAGRLSRYFIWNDGDGKFLNFTKSRGIAQDPLAEDDLKSLDFLQSNIDIPIFSKKAKLIFEIELPDEMEFHEITISSGLQEHLFFLAKIKTRLDLVDEARSSFRPSRGEDPIITKAAFKESISVDFGIARDSKNLEEWVVTDKFTEICRKFKLNIFFSPIT